MTGKISKALEIYQKEEKEKKRREIKRYIFDNPGCTWKDLEELDMSTRTLRNKLDVLRDFDIIEKKRDSNDRRVYRYYPTSEWKKSPLVQAHLCRELLDRHINDSFDPEEVYEQVRLKSLEEIFDMVEDNIIKGGKKIYSYLKENHYEIVLEGFKNEELKVAKERLKSTSFFSEETMRGQPNDKIIEWRKKWYLASTLLLQPKRISAYKLTIDRLMNRMITTEDLKIRRTLNRVIVSMLSDSSNDSYRHYFKAEELSSEEEKKIEKGIDDILSMGPEKRYEKYNKDLESYIETPYKPNIKKLLNKIEIK